MSEISRPFNRIFLHVRNFKKALDQYNGTVPLAKFLQGFFKLNKQMGSKDRKMASRFLYHYFRLGNAAAELELEQRLAVADFLCSDQSDLVLEIFPEWASHISETLDAKIDFLQKTIDFRLTEVFPFHEFLSEEIVIADFCKSFLQQPAVFVRVRRGKMHQVQLILRGAEILYMQRSETCLELPPNSPLDRVPQLKGLIEIQDLSSQKTLDDVKASPSENWWDACSGAGGKSLLFLDRYPQVNILVSDKRASILKNLDERFDLSGVRDYQRKILDLADDSHKILGDTLFDGIILDVPCSGSGTWGRTPEMSSTFDPSQITVYSDLQKKILRHALAYLKPGKILVYITCSVFIAENEEVLDAVLSSAESEFFIERSSYLKGYLEKADSMFVAWVRRGDA